jgi:hypothetical protein
MRLPALFVQHSITSMIYRGSRSSLASSSSDKPPPHEDGRSEQETVTVGYVDSRYVALHADSKTMQ